MEHGDMPNSTSTEDLPAGLKQSYALLRTLWRFRQSPQLWSCSPSFSVVYDLARIATSSLALAAVSGLFRMVLSYQLGRLRRLTSSSKPCETRND